MSGAAEISLDDDDRDRDPGMAGDAAYVGLVTREDAMGAGCGGQHGAEVGVGDGHSQHGHDIGSPVGGILVKGAVGGPEAVDGNGVPGPPVPAGLDPDGGRYNEMDGADPAKV